MCANSADQLEKITDNESAQFAMVEASDVATPRFLVIHGRRDSGYICNLDWLTCDNVVIETEHDHASKYS